MKKMFILLFLTINLLVLNSCFTEPNPFGCIESGNYIYSKLNNYDGYASLVGFADGFENGKNIVFPTTLDELKINSIGVKSGFEGISLIINNSENVYIGSNYSQVVTSIEYNEMVLRKIFVGGEKIDLRIFGSLLSSEKYMNGDYTFFVSNNFFTEMVSSHRIDIANVTPANVVYYLEDGQSFFVDDCDGTTVNVIPPTPYREGYIFVGWYKEPECINEWDFENDIVPSKEYDENGEYILKETKLYAKWEREK